MDVQWHFKCSGVVRPSSVGSAHFQDTFGTGLCYLPVKVKAELEQRLPVSDSPGPPVAGPTWPLPPSSPRSPQAGPATRPSTRFCFAAPAPQAASDRLPTTGPRLPSTRRAIPITRILSAPPLPRLCRAHVPPSASSGRCAGARRRAGRARHAVAASHWSL